MTIHGIPVGAWGRAVVTLVGPVLAEGVGDWPCLQALATSPCLGFEVMVGEVCQAKHVALQGCY